MFLQVVSICPLLSKYKTIVVFTWKPRVFFLSFLISFLDLFYKYKIFTIMALGNKLEL